MFAMYNGPDLYRDRSLRGGETVNYINQVDQHFSFLICDIIPFAKMF